MNRENLQRLADYLQSGKLLAKFDMCFFCLSGNNNNEDTCGTVGCAIGHSPYAGISKFIYESWSSYSERVFGLCCLSSKWNWCFDSDWAEVDQTPLGAAKRILYLLAHNAPPPQWRFNKETVALYSQCTTAHTATQS